MACPPAFSSGQISPDGNTVCINSHCFEVELPNGIDEFMRGLQFRTSLPENRGMLFIFTESDTHRFWMKDTLIPLDMIWLDQDRRIVHIEENVPPCRQDPCPVYTPSKPALYVLEINAHEVQRMGLHTGDQAEFHLADDKR